MTEPDFARLDDDHIRMAAVWSAWSLRDHGVARVELTPGDHTEYQILVTAPGPKWVNGDERMGHVHYAVALYGYRLGDIYPWAGQEVHWTFAEEKWCRGNRCAAEVMARYLNALRLAIAELADAACDHEWVAENSTPDGVLLTCLRCNAEAIQDRDGTIVEVEEFS